MAKYSYVVRAFLAITKALSDSNRLRILAALRGRELCVCQVTELLALAPSTISKHLAILQQADLIQSRKDERWVFYRLPDTSPEVVSEALDWVHKALRQSEAIRADGERLKAVLRENPSELCRRQCRS